MSGYVYFIREEGGAVKIGYTHELDKRLRALQTANPRLLAVLGIVAGERALEGKLHRRFIASHIRGEWFDYSEDLADFVRKETARYVPCLQKAESDRVPREWKTVKRATEITSLSRSELYKLMDARRLEYTKIGSTRRIPLDALERLVESQAESVRLNAAALDDVSSLPSATFYGPTADDDEPRHTDRIVKEGAD